MNHVQVHINQDKKGDTTKIRTQQYTQLNTDGSFTKLANIIIATL